MREHRAATTRTVLLTVLLAVVTALTGASLLIVWRRMRQQVTADFSRGLNTSAQAFRHADADRMSALQREANLLADLPSLKALMTTNDDRTIEDGAVQFWKTSGNDLFAIAGRDGRTRALFMQGPGAEPSLRRDLTVSFQQHGQYLFSAGRLFRFAAAPVYFGDAESGTLLGYVVSGYAIDAEYLSQVSEQADAIATVVSGRTVLASSAGLPDAAVASLPEAALSSQPQTVTLAGERYLAVDLALATQPATPLSLVLLKPLLAPEREIREITRLLLLIGVAIVLLGSGVMLVVARSLTRPLEELARRVREFGAGETRSPGLEDGSREGTREVQELAADFEGMQEHIRRSNQARLESERLATIGSMASSVSHDLRHYLASIYANAEFLAGSDTTDSERSEFLEDIRIAVLGTTEMLESLMIFGRTGNSVRHAPEQLDALLGRAIAQVKRHPDADGIRVSALPCGDGFDMTITGDGKQLERALYNLLLNACQAARSAGGKGIVTAEVLASDEKLAVRITDNGPGVPEAVQGTLFDPFVSQGKQNGTGLGLTLSRCIAEEHGGQVYLENTCDHGTVFAISLPQKGVARAKRADPVEVQVGGVM